MVFQSPNLPISNLQSLILLILSLIPSAVFAQDTAPSPPSTELTEAEYWQFAQDSLDYVAGLEEGEGDFEQLAKGWADLSAVILANGDTIPVDHSDLADSIRNDELDTVYNRLAVLVDLEAELREEIVDDDAEGDARERPILPDFAYTPPDLNNESVEDILARPRFRVEESTLEQGDSIWARLWNYILDVIFDGADAVSNIPFLRQLLTGIGFVFLLSIVGIALWQLGRNMRSGAAMLHDEFEIDRQLGADGALKKAQTLSGEGDYRTAVRYLYLSTLLELENRDLLIYDRSRTNREYLRDIADKPEMASLFKDVVGVFDSVWYGFQPLSEEAYQTYQRRVEALQK